ncbi:hypothetical protein GSI_09928 [Ganoderma sinense ZZ0214-1]|uniref:Uncharacterized protein n=1 Tax=Ganoderma sinense ZZ0214-1 TaxID=1077348 RepID=A0A2G8S2L4_9APHY|nr:hypothetical protein GSI_09928 [Ganoderma sinense ZZ0214-1]
MLPLMHTVLVFVEIQRQYKAVKLMEGANLRTYAFAEDPARTSKDGGDKPSNSDIQDAMSDQPFVSKESGTDASKNFGFSASGEDCKLAAAFKNGIYALVQLGVEQFVGHVSENGLPACKLER